MAISSVGMSADYEIIFSNQLFKEGVTDFSFVGKYLGEAEVAPFYKRKRAQRVAHRFQLKDKILGVAPTGRLDFSLKRRVCKGDTLRVEYHGKNFEGVHDWRVFIIEG